MVQLFEEEFSRTDLPPRNRTKPDFGIPCFSKSGRTRQAIPGEENRQQAEAADVVSRRAAASSAERIEHLAEE